MERILIVGGSGLLGSSLARFFKSKFQTYLTYFRSKPTENNSRVIFLDATHIENIIKIIQEIQPTLVINAAGFSNVEACEKLPEKTFLINSFLAFNLAEVTFRNSIKFIHISTDHFTSEENTARKESVEFTPLNQYGYSKFLAEKYVQTYNPNSIIIRTNFFGFNQSSNSFLSNIYNNLISNQEIYGFVDVFFTPISTSSLSEIVNELLFVDFRGIINVCGVQEVSKLNFVEMVCSQLRKPKSLIKPKNSTEISERVIRPNYLSLDISLLKSLLPNYRFKSLLDMIKEELELSN